MEADRIQPPSLHPPGDALCVMTPGRLTSALRGAVRAAQQPRYVMHRVLLHGSQDLEEN